MDNDSVFNNPVSPWCRPFFCSFVFESKYRSDRCDLGSALEWRLSTVKADKNLNYSLGRPSVAL